MIICGYFRLPYWYLGLFSQFIPLGKKQRIFDRSNNSDIKLWILTTYFITLLLLFIFLWIFVCAHWHSMCFSFLTIVMSWVNSSVFLLKRTTLIIINPSNTTQFLIKWIEQKLFTYNWLHWQPLRLYFGVCFHCH